MSTAARDLGMRAALVGLGLALGACSEAPGGAPGGEAPTTPPAPSAPSASPTEPQASDQDPPASSAARSAPLFRELTVSSGLTFHHDPGREGNRELPETLGGGAAWLDWNGDGHLDLYLAQSGPLRELDGSEDRDGAENELWSGDGAGGLELAPDQAADRGYGQGVHAADLDGDGRVDLMALNWGRNGIWRNAAGGFQDVTATWGMGGDTSWSVSAAVLDYDADGDLDVYVVNYLEVAPRAHLDARFNPNAPGPHKGYPHPDRYPAQPDQLWRNDLDTTGVLTEVTASMGVADLDPQKGLGAIPTDIELDGWVDLYVANDATPNMLLHNQAGATFLEDARKLGLAYNESGDTEAGMGVDTLDVDRDGDLDLFVTNLDMETNSLYLNRSFERPRASAPDAQPVVGRLAFRDRTLRMGLAAPSRGYVGFGVVFVDVDLDGDGDSIVVNGHVVDNIEEISDTRLYAQPNQVYLNDGMGRFDEAPPELLPDAFRIPTVSRGSALGDLDGDLDLDLCVANNGGPAQVFAGTPPADRPRLALRLVGPGKNTEGLGATVWLRFEDAPTWLGRLDRSRSYASASDAMILVGLPGELREIEVLWPGGERQVYRDELASLGPLGGALTLRHRD